MRPVTVDDHKIGKVDHNHDAGAGSQAIVEVGGFLGIGTEPVAVPLADLDFMRDEHGGVLAVTSWTNDQLEDTAGPPFVTLISANPSTS